MRAWTKKGKNKNQNNIIHDEKEDVGYCFCYKPLIPVLLFMHVSL